MQFEKDKLYKYLGNDLVNLFRENKVIIAGGCITSLFCNRDIADIDVYMRNEKSLTNVVTDLYDGNWVVSHTNKATLFKCGENKLIQLIHIGYFNNPEEVFERFDFTVCMGAFDFETEEFVLHKDFLIHNSQRILKLNGDTQFPLMSALRIDKYKQKGYKISKSEFVRVLLSCMNLNIETYRDLKEHIGGMYGLNLDVVFDETKEFSLSEALDQLSKVSVNDYTSPGRLDFDSVDELIDNILDYKSRQYFKIGNKKYLIKSSGRIVETSSLPGNAIQIDAAEYFKNRKIYKYVNKRGDKYFSYNKSDFEYKLGDTVVAIKNGWDYDGKLYCGFLEGKDNFTYSYEGSLIELEIEDINDIVEISGYEIRIKKAKFIREVPEDENREHQSIWD